MNLATVQKELEQARTRLRELEDNLQRVINLRSQNCPTDPLTRRYNAELSQYAQELINLHLDPRAYMMVGLIAVVSGILTLVIAQFNR